MSTSVTIFLIICLFGFALMIALNLKSPVVTYFYGPQTSVGGPLSFVREKGYVHYLTSLDIEKYSTEEILMTIHSYVDNIDVLCGRKFRMGNIGDGGWEICDDPDVRPKEPCIIYSFGIAGDFSFDDEAARLYGCHVYSFDPSMTQENNQFDRSSNVHFYKIGLDHKTYVNYENCAHFETSGKSWDI